LAWLAQRIMVSSVASPDGVAQSTDGWIHIRRWV